MSAMEKKTGEKKNFFAPVEQFFKEVRGELRKVVYPTLKHVRKNTTVVIIVVIIVGVFIAGLDLVFNAGRNLIIKSDPTTTNQVQQDTTSQQQIPQQQIPQQAPAAEGSNQ